MFSQKQSSHYYETTLFRVINEVQLYSIDAGYSLEQSEKFKHICEIKEDPIIQSEIPQLFEDLHLTTLVIFSNLKFS